MKYTVLWAPKAEQDLATLWANASDRTPLTKAADAIDRQLRRDPEKQGESRPHRRRILLIPPLGVMFKAYPQDRLVRVLQVWRFEKGRKG